MALDEQPLAIVATLLTLGGILFAAVSQVDPVLSTPREVSDLINRDKVEKRIALLRWLFSVFALVLVAAAALFGAAAVDVMRSFSWVGQFAPGRATVVLGFLGLAAALVVVAGQLRRLARW